MMSRRAAGRRVGEFNQMVGRNLGFRRGQVRHALQVNLSLLAALLAREGGS
ncbi:hypothetical protein [Methylobacterium sp. CM6257]